MVVPIHKSPAHLQLCETYARTNLSALQEKIFAAALTVPYMAIYARWLAVTSGRSLGDKGHSTLAIGAPHSPSHFSHVSLFA